MVGMCFADVFYTKIFDTEGENNWSPLVCPDTRGAFALVINLFVQAFLEYLLGNQPGLVEAVHVLSNFDIDVIVFGDFDGKFIVMDDIVG